MLNLPNFVTNLTLAGPNYSKTEKSMTSNLFSGRLEGVVSVARNFEGFGRLRTRDSLAAPS